MEWIINNWFLVVCALAIIVVAVAVIIKFFNMPTNEQVKAVKEWLVFAVMLAEKELKEKTGQEKLRMVYDMFLSKFTWLAKVVSFEIFSLWVDEALERFKRMLESNKNLQGYVGV